MVYEDEVKSNGSVVYTIPQKSSDFKAYKKAMHDFFSQHAKDYDVL